jgi:predicted Rossmann fold nucleotide-binding protein DprA/Smf involved in DNA uptake
VCTSQLIGRDRIQTGLSGAVILCGCELTSRTMRTARLCLAQGLMLVVIRSPEPARPGASAGNLALVERNGCDQRLLFAIGGYRSGSGLADL